MSSQTLGSLEIDALTFSEIAAGAGALARGMRDNPNHVAIFGPDPDKRVRALALGFAAYLRVAPAQTPLRARLDGVVVGVAGVPGPGSLSAPGNPEAAAGPIDGGIDDWRHPAGLAHHTRLGRTRPRAGPFASGSDGSRRRAEGRGIGTRLLETYCGQLDAAHLGAYLETETARNVRFYERFGFETIDRALVLGNPNWFMWRSAR